MTDDDDALAGGSAGPVMSLATHTKRVDVDHAPLSSIGATFVRPPDSLFSGAGRAASDAERAGRSVVFVDGGHLSPVNGGWTTARGDRRSSVEVVANARSRTSRANRRSRRCRCASASRFGSPIQSRSAVSGPSTAKNGLLD